MNHVVPSVEMCICRKIVSGTAGCFLLYSKMRDWLAKDDCF